MFLPGDAPARPAARSAPPPALGRGLANVGRALGRSLTTRPPTPVAASQPRPLAQGTAQTPTARLAKAIARRMWTGPNQPFLAPLDSIARDGRLPRAVQQSEVAGQFHQDFSNLQQQGLLPPGAKEPPITFADRGLGGSERSFESGGRIFFSPAEVAGIGRAAGLFHDWAEEVPIHELAHTLQNASTLSSIPLREGGAQAYADAVVPRVLGPIPTRDTNYSGYVNQVRAKQGVPWFMRGQFR